MITAVMNTEEMVIVADVFRESYDHVLNNTFGDSKTEIIGFVASMVLSEKPYLLLTEEGLARMMQMVFSSEIRRDFLFMLNYTFNARIGLSSDRQKALVGNIVAGACQVDHNQPYVAMPPEISNRLPGPEDAMSVLQGNQWLMMILLIQLFIRVTEPTPSRT